MHMRRTLAVVVGLQREDDVLDHHCTEAVQRYANFRGMGGWRVGARGAATPHPTPKQPPATNAPRSLPHRCHPYPSTHNPSLPPASVLLPPQHPPMPVMDQKMVEAAPRVTSALGGPSGKMEANT